MQLNRIRPFLPKLFILFIVLLGLGFLEVYIPLQMRTIVDATLDGNNKLFKDTALVIIILVILIFPMRILFNILEGLFIKDSLKSMKSNYVNGVFEKNINEFQKENNATYISSLTNDYNIIETNYLKPLVDFMSSIIFFAAGVIVIGIVSPVILLIAFGIMLINVVISIIASKPLNKHNKQRSNLFSQYTSYIKEVLSAFHIIKTNNLSKKVTEDFQDKSYRVQQKGYIIDRIQSIVYAIQQTNFSLTFFGLIIVVGIMALNGDVTFGGVVLIVQGTDKLVWPIQLFSESISKIFSVKSIFKRINDTLENHEDFIESQPFDGFKDQIKFNNVDFSYEDDNEVLKDISISFEKNKKYLIVGPSGGGKSTVLKLLRKYFNPQYGEILIDNIPLKDIKKEEYFSHIANIEQQIFLFEDTVRNNLTLYKDYTDEEIFDAIEKSGLDDFIKGLPDGLDSMIYDNGMNISGGERSRIAIARGLINKADIIFLDEAFASLDAEKAKSIEKSILNLENVTIINVSHVVFQEHRNLYDNVFVVKNKSIYN